jgi:hypothetical protein
MFNLPWSFKFGWLLSFSGRAAEVPEPEEMIGAENGVSFDA